MTMGPIQKTFLVLRPFEGAMFNSDSRNSSYAQKNVFSKERDLAKARILDS
jgi:hypothetical protein